MNNTQIKSAPLPERSIELKTRCTVLCTSDMAHYTPYPGLHEGANFQRAESRPLTLHWLALVARTTETVAIYSRSLGFLHCSDFNLRSHASSTHAEKFAPGFSSFSRSMLASTFSIMPCGKRIPLYVVLLFIWFFFIPHPIYCLNKSKDTPVNHGVKLFKQISLTCLNALLNLFKQFEIIRLVKVATPRSVRALPRRLTTNDSKVIEVAMKNHITHPKGRDSYKLNKFDRHEDAAAVYGIFTSSGLCFLSQSLSAAFMRVCQPLPVALNASTTSGEQRKVTRTLGVIAFGRPRLTSFSPSYKSAAEKNASSSSGASSGSFQVFFKSCAFAFIGFPHGDNTPHVTAWRPDQDYNAPIKFSGCYIPRFAVVFAYILSGKMFTRKHLTSPRKIKATLVNRPVAFVIVEVNFHVIIVRTKNNFANCLRWLVVMSYAYPAPYKTGAGIGTPKLLEATPDAESVFFVVCYTRHSMAWCAIYPQGLRCRLAGLLTHHAAHNGGICRSIRPVNEYIDKLSTEGIFRRQRMVTLAGLPKGRPVSSNAGSSNPVNVTAPVEIGTSSGDSLNLLEEAA